MSTDRDTKFRGFANLLYHDLLQVIRDYKPADEWNREEVYRLQELRIAQRAYDLTAYVLEEVDTNVLHYRGVETAILGIPDLSAWPTPPTSAPQDPVPD